MSHAELDPHTRTAIDWMLRLDPGRVTNHDRQDFKRWLADDPAHLLAWQRVSSLLQQPLADLQGAEGRSPGQLRAASRALSAPDSPQRRKLLRGGLALLVLGAGSAALVNRVTPVTGLTADVHTATGERRTLQLADGSRLVLNARSAVDIRFDGSRRLLRLREGEVLVTVAADAARPFIIATAQGEVWALGTRFLVRQEEARSLVCVQEHSVRIDCLDGRQGELGEGHAAWFGAAGIQPASASLLTRAAWVDGRVEVDDEPLGHLVEALRPYHRGLLRISPEAAQVRVFGVFPLDDSGAALQSLAETMPVRVRRFGPWLTLIDRA
ncbi:membrane protein [Pseudomonas tohonis]|uniref:Membrane protein n=1 Tax=Pseudomonas tohonis TaxID=2725477 RepID=A0A6J4EB79_9PSED|nr:FecR family protein [Pseudomonas tohonis]BCG26685.1 membrane protein [Pseudomonas tohonis]GJN50579.1 membrane protein [Pseudomonas tohonis]